MNDLEIIILEDQQLTADFLAEIVRRNGHPDPRVFSNPVEAEKFIRGSTYPQLLFCDINLHGHNLGLEFAEKLYNKYRTHVIVISAYSDDAFVQKAMEINATYLVKPVQRKQVEVALKMMLQRVSHPGNQNSQAPLLSKRESEILKLIAQGLSSRQIAESLYISYETVLTHRRNMLKRNNASNCNELISQVHQF